MSKIAYDLDGVLLPDCDRLPGVGGLNEFYQLMEFVRPLFQPKEPYSIITARLATYRESTQRWISKYLDIAPEKLYHDITDNNAALYKTTVLNSTPDIQIYIESDLSIVEFLRQHVNTGCKIYHFSNLTQTTIESL
jgi:hypothetical protein